MNRITALLGGALVAAGLGVNVLAHEGEHKEGKDDKVVTITGELIDTACFVASDGDAKGEDHAECAQNCMATGIPAGVLPEGSRQATDLRFLLTNPKVLAPYAAHTVKVEGVEHAEVHAIDVKKLYVKDGEKWMEVKLDDEHHKMTEGGHDDKDAAKHKAHTDHKHD